MVARMDVLEIIIIMMINWLGVSVTHFEALFYPFRVLPLLNRRPKLSVSNTKIAMGQPKLILLFFFFPFFFLQPG